MLISNTAVPDAETKAGLLHLYRSDDRPWIVAFSGGKDSTLVLQLVFEMLIENRRFINKPVFVISSDTGVEPPNIAAYLKKTLQMVEDAAKNHNLPLHVRTVQPSPEESFWGKLIGKGYPSPTRWFRWCTASMKIRPSRREIKRVIRDYGSVILLLGTRMDESPERSRCMLNREYSEKGLNPHSEIPDALVATPISHWTTEQVWDYLLRVHSPAPWGGSHEHMAELYRQATGGECHFILDLLSPSCGGSRFGCWTCTVIKEDRSIRGFIASGEEWMLPLNKFRNWLKDLREDMNARMPVRRDLSKGPGPFTPDTRRVILERLLDAEKQSGVRLIADEEIAYIQEVWTKEFDHRQSAFSMAKSFGREVVNMRGSHFSTQEQQIMDDLLREFELSPDLIDKLLNLVSERYPSLEVWGAKTALQDDMADTIERAVLMRETADAGNDL
jgi:DNA sulfur modification protein DndC